MRGTMCLFNPTVALRRAFVTQALSFPEPTWQLQRVLLPRLRVTASNPIAHANDAAHQKRNATQRHFGPKYHMKAKLNRLPRDREIESKYVIIPDDDGKLTEPRITSLVLSKLDLNRYSLVVVRMPPSPKKKGEEAARGQQEGTEEDQEEGEEEQASDPNAPKYPICRIIDKKVEYDLAMAKAKEERRKAVGTKEIELNWAIAENDLRFRLRHLKNFLEKGLRVDVLMMYKAQKGKKARKVGVEDMTGLLEMVEEAAKEVPGAKEYKPRMGKIGGQQLRVFYEGIPVKKTQDASEKGSGKKGAPERAEEGLERQVEA